MDARRPLVHGGHSPIGLLNHGSANLLTPRAAQIEPFKQDASRVALITKPSPRHSAMAQRVSLSTMQFGSVLPSPELLTVSLARTSPCIIPTHSTDSKTTTSSPPSEFLASLRAKALLDYQFMREFSLAKRKPREDRNLSRMSASSVYSMRMAQMDLGQQAKRLQRLQLPPSTLVKPLATKADGDIRQADSTVSRPPSQAETRGPSPPDICRNIASLRRQVSQDEASSYFPTLWTPSGATVNGENGTVYKLKYRQPQPPSSVHVSAAPSKLVARKQSNHDKLTTSPGSMLSEGLSDFDMRKCHPASSVTAQHGYLQEQDLPKLLEETGYDRTELYGLWIRFKALCAIAKSPKGIDKDTFRRGIPQLSVEDQFFIDRVFDILDADSSGILEWQEFVEALSALEKGDIAKRVGFLFRVYDLNGDGGAIHRNKVVQFFLASLLVETTDELVEVAKHFVGKIFEDVGCGDVDTMQIDDALRYMKEHPSADIYSLFGRTMVTKQRTTGIAASFRPENSVPGGP